jgi:hypothetical protein
MEHPNLDDVARRPVQYWNVDGLPELMMGLLWMVWGGAWLFGETLPHDWSRTAYWLVVPALLALSPLAVHRAVRALKLRLTFPRTGYVDWNAPSRSARLVGAAVAVLVAAALAVLILTTGPRQPQATTVILGVMLSLGFLAVSLRQRAPHFLALAGVAAALGLAIGTLKAGWASTNWLFVALGAACAATGSLRLVRFLRRNPKVPQEGL